MCEPVKKVSVKQLESHFRKGGNPETAQVMYKGKRSKLLEKARRAKENVFDAFVGFVLPESCALLHRIRASFLLLLLGLLTRHALLKKLEQLEVGSRAFKFALAILCGSMENFVREFDRGSRLLWAMLVLFMDQPLLQFVLIFVVRAYLVDGARIDAFSTRLHAARLHHAIDVEMICRICESIGPGLPTDHCYKVFGYGNALKPAVHAQYKGQLLEWVRKLGAENPPCFPLTDPRRAAALLCPGTGKNMPFTAYQIVCDILRCASLRAFTRIDRIPPPLTCCGSGCLCHSWEEITAKNARLKKDSRWRALVAKLGLSLASTPQYIEHADCAERKFGGMEDAIVAGEVPDWSSLLDAWLERRDPAVYKCALKNLRILWGDAGDGEDAPQAPLQARND